MIFVLILVLAVFFLLLLVIQPAKVIYIKLLSTPVLCLVFIICLVIFSKAVVKSALNGLILWASIVVPSLFPFFVAAEIMNSTGFMRTVGILLEPVMKPLFNVPGCASFALALGVTSGYPVGAKITADMRKSGSLTKLEAERLLAFTNNSGPLFIIGAVGTGMFGSSSTGLFLFICHFLSCITVGIIFRFYKRRDPGRKSRSSSISFKGSVKASVKGSVKCSAKTEIKRQIFEAGKKKSNFGIMLGGAIKSSVSTILAIGGFIVLFSVIICLLNETGLISTVSESVSKLLPAIIPGKSSKDLVSGVLSGLLEITTGSGLVSRITSVPLSLKLPAVSFLIGWAGLSVHFQVMSIVAETDINIRPYLLGKFFQGLIAAIYTLAGIQLLDLELLSLEPALGVPVLDLHGFLTSMGNSVLLLLILSVIWLFIYYRGSKRHISRSL